ncbi:hypothetical protein EDC96DRAFT_566239 [Choanephora cucurbitarum]|nr:hypothetical protein EDC96DRAFT_566239 [Choanephora cucurbitarum]
MALTLLTWSVIVCFLFCLLHFNENQREGVYIGIEERLSLQKNKESSCCSHQLPLVKPSTLDGFLFRFRTGISKAVSYSHVPSRPLMLPHRYEIKDYYICSFDSNLKK